MKHETIGQRIGLLVRAKDIKQREIAEALELSPSQITRFLNGESEIKAEKLVLLLDHLGISIDTLLEKEMKRVSGIKDNDVSPGDLINEVIGTLPKTKRSALVDFVTAYATHNAPSGEHKRIGLLKDLI